MHIPNRSQIPSAPSFDVIGSDYHDEKLSLSCSFHVGHRAIASMAIHFKSERGDATDMSAWIFRFADFELDRNLYELRCKGRPLKLERIPLDLLFLLVERRDHLVVREEILERIWGKGVFLDADSAINSAVRKIRRALHDDPDTPQFIATVPTKGYRFVAEIREPDRHPSQSMEVNADDTAISTAAPVRYTRSGDVHIAYRIFGDGPRDIVMIPGTLSHLEFYWATPAYRHLLKRLTALTRVIVFDKRGQGLSDRVVAEQTLEERIDDVRAVMDAAGSKRAIIYGWSEGGPMSLMFAATYPERATALVLYGTFASIKDPPWAESRERWEEMIQEWEARWGEGILLRVNAPSIANVPSKVQWCGMLERASASPGSIAALMRANYEMDVRHILPTIAIPTLVMHRTEDALVPVAAGRYLAEHIPGARYAEIPGTDHAVLDSATQDIIADEIEKLINGAPHRPEPDRVLTTMMLASIEDAKAQKAQSGGELWRELMQSSYEVLRAELAAFRGRELKMTSDGLMAIFDGPARAIKFACSSREKIRALGLQLRVGLHTGECELIGDDAGGIAVDIATWVTSLANPGEILLSSTVKDLVAGSNLQFMDCGMHTFEVATSEWRLFKTST
jgi:pimeloyl-ACP methyl ester carboxylesterase/DNA-binding winged helix-turn-helix (wHTH) protein